MQIIDLNPQLEILGDREAAAVQAGLTIDVPFFSGVFDFSSDSSVSMNGYSSRRSTRRSSRSTGNALDGISLAAPSFRLSSSILSFPGGVIEL